MNSEGYKDTTAEHAIRNSNHIPTHIWNVIRIARDLLNVARLDIVDITVEDRKTKRKYRWER